MSAFTFFLPPILDLSYDLELTNLKPICARCNLSMGNTHMITWINEHYSSNINNFNDKLKLYLSIDF